jgi:heptosyltransferase-2
MKILIIRAGALGDSLMLMPAIRQLRLNADIVMAGRHPGIDYIRPYVNQCIDFEVSGWHRLYVKGLGLGTGIGMPEISHVAGFLSDPDGVVMENLRVCFPSASVHIFPVFPRVRKKEHIALYMAESLETMGLPIDGSSILSDSLRNPLLAEDIIPQKGDGIILQPGSGSKNKNYSPDMWMGLIDTLKGLLKKGSKRIILLTGPAEEGMNRFFENALSEGMLRQITSPEKRDLLTLLNGASLYIGHDSGVTHLAAMLGIPVIALFRDSSVQQWAPLGPKVKIMKREEDERFLIKRITEEAREYIDV